MKKKAYHYVARLKGTMPTRFYHEEGSGPVDSTAAEAFAGWTDADVTLWPTSRPGEYNAVWFDKYSSRIRETKFVILEEAGIDVPSARRRR